MSDPGRAALRLRIVSVPSGQMPPQQQLLLTNAPVSIGRGEGNDLVLPDPLALVSRQHCRIEPVGGAWHLTDLSTNGAFVNDGPVGKGGVVPLQAGDMVRMGEYVLAVETVDAPLPAQAAMPAMAARPEQDPHDPFGVRDLAHGMPPAPVDDGPAIPPDADLFGDLSQPDSRGGRGMSPPRPGQDLWQDQPAVPSADAPAAFDSHAVPLPTPQGEPAGGIPNNWLDAEPAPPPTPRQAARSAAAIREPLAPRAPAPPEAAMRAAGGDDALLQAFLSGSGASDLPAGIDPVAAMHSLGEANRLLLGTLSRLLAARRALKGEFRISQTVIGARDNNPLKFSADEGEMVMMLLGVTRPGFQSGPAAMADACRDLEEHQLSLLAGFRAALDMVLQRLSPQAIEAGHKGGLLSGKAKLWERYEAAYEELKRDVSNNLSGQLGQAFTAAYEAESNRRGS